MINMTKKEYKMKAKEFKVFRHIARLDPSLDVIIRYLLEFDIEERIVRARVIYKSLFDKEAFAEALIASQYINDKELGTWWDKQSKKTIKQLRKKADRRYREGKGEEYIMEILQSRSEQRPRP